MQKYGQKAKNQEIYVVFFTILLFQSALLSFIWKYESKENLCTFKGQIVSLIHTLWTLVDIFL